MPVTVQHILCACSNFGMISGRRPEKSICHRHRRNATGGATEEIRRTSLDKVLSPHIAKVAALDIPARFADEIALREEAIRFAAQAIAT